MKMTVSMPLSLIRKTDGRARHCFRARRASAGSLLHCREGWLPSWSAQDCEARHPAQAAGRSPRNHPHGNGAWELLSCLFFA